MTDSTSTTIFSKIPLINSDDNETRDENRKISYWLEKLHIQGEKVRIDNNRREEQANIVTHNKSDERTTKDDNNLKQSGIDLYTRTTAAKNEADIQMVNDLVRKSNRRIISISSSFPLSFFQNTVDVEESRVTFKFRQFFSLQSHSVDIKDISNVFIESSIFFATLQIVSRTFIQNDIKISHLNKNKAYKIRRIIEGLRTFAEHDINTSNYEIDELISKIGEFNTTK